MGNHWKKRQSKKLSINKVKNIIKKKEKFFTVISLLTVIAVLIVLSLVKERVILQKRIEDVRLVAKQYKEMSMEGHTNIDIQSVVRELANQKKTLNNAVCINPSIPCYEIVASTNNVMKLKGVLVSENNNVKRRNRVLCLMDGSVIIQDKSSNVSREFRE